MGKKEAGHLARPSPRGQAPAASRALGAFRDRREGTAGRGQPGGARRAPNGRTAGTEVAPWTAQADSAESTGARASA